MGRIERVISWESAKLTFLLQLVPPQPSLGNLEPLDYPLEPVQHTPEPWPADINLLAPTNVEWVIRFTNPKILNIQSNYRTL